MPLTGTLLANFESFYTAVNKAEVELRGFETTAGSVSTSLKKMADSFSGDKIIKDASLMTQAYRDLANQGIRLTDAEQRRMNATLEEAIAKFRAMGRDAPAEMRKVAEATRGASQAAQSWGQQATNLARTLGVAFSVGAIVQFGRSLLELGDELVKVADRTGLTTEEVQRLSHIAGQSGNSLEDFTGAISQLQKRLVGDRESLVPVMQLLKLSFADLEAKGPYEQLIAISEAISRLPNPANQAQAAITLFGKSGAEILPTLKAHMKDLGDQAAVMSDKTVRALDQAGDSLRSFQETTKVWAAETYNWFGKVFDFAVAGTYKMAEAFFQTIAKLDSWAMQLPGASKMFPQLASDMKTATQAAQWFSDASASVYARMDLLEPAIRAVVPPITEVEKATKKATKELKDYKDEIKLIAGLNETAGFRVELTMPTAVQLDAIIREFTDKVHTGLSGQLGEEVSAGFKEAVKNGEEFLAWAQAHSFAKIALGIPASLQAALTGGGGLSGFGQALTAQVSGWATQPLLTSAVNKSASSLSGVFGTGFVSALGNMIPGIGSMLGTVFGKVASAIAGLFKNQGHEAATTFAEGFGGFDALRQKLLVLGDAGEQLWKRLTQTSNKGAAEQAAKDIQKALEEADKKATAFNSTLGGLLGRVRDLGGGLPASLRGYLDELERAGRLTEDNIGLLGQLVGEGETNWQAVADAVSRYGGDIEKLGGSFQNARMHDQWQQIIDDMDTFERGGVSAGDALDLVKGKVNDLVIQSMKFGTEIPENAKPWIEQLAREGKLLDENGQKITDTSKLTFGESLQTTMKELVKTMQDLIDQFANKLPGAIAGAPKTYTIDVIERRHYKYYEGNEENLAATGGMIGRGRILRFPMGRGGPVGTDTVPLWGTPGEIILNAAQQANLALALRSPARTTASTGPLVVQVVLDGRIVAESVVPHWPAVTQGRGVA